MRFQNGVFLKIFLKCLAKPKLEKQSLDTQDPKNYMPIAKSSLREPQQKNYGDI